MTEQGLESGPLSLPTLFPWVPTDWGLLEAVEESQKEPWLQDLGLNPSPTSE